ncbi:hypothetical protein T439DRAFT_356203 [Meredithblackwellia eburnea MCA 4105]
MKVLREFKSYFPRANNNKSPYNDNVFVVDSSLFDVDEKWTEKNAQSLSTAKDVGNWPGLYTTKPGATLSYQATFTEAWYSGYAGAKGGIYSYEAGTMWSSKFSFSIVQAYTVYSGDQAVLPLPATREAPSSTSSKSSSKSSTAKEDKAHSATSEKGTDNESKKETKTTILNTVGTSVETVTQSISTATSPSDLSSSNSPTGSGSNSSPQPSTSEDQNSFSIGGLSQTTVWLLVAGLVVVVVALVIGIAFRALKSSNTPRLAALTENSLSKRRKSGRRLLNEHLGAKKRVPLTSDSETEGSSFEVSDY